MDESEKSIRQVDKNLLDLLWKLTNNKSNSRIDATADILNILQRKQNEANDNKSTKDLTYTVERLIKGLASSRDAARLGFALLLTEILKQIDVVDIEDVLELMKKHLTFNSKQDKRDVIFAEIFAYSAIVRSGKLPNHSHLSFVVIQIHDLWQGKGYISNACYEILTDLFSQLSPEKFQESIWPTLQPKLASGFETCSANTLWPLLLCMRMFPDVVTEKYLKKHWKTEDIFSADQYEHLKKIIRQTTSCLPMLHPLCLEFVALFKSRKDMKDIWNAVVDENLFEADHTEKAYVGFEMVKNVLQSNPKKKIIKYVLSPKFRTMFARCFINTKHPMHPAAEVLAGFLSEFVKQNSDPDVQMIIFKVFLQPPGSLLCDQIFQRKEVSSIIQNLLPDAVKDYCEFLKSVAISKINIDEEDGAIHKRFQAVIQIGALVCHPIMTADIEWRLTIIKFLFLHSFFKINKPIDLVHCEEISEEIPAPLRESFSNMFFKTVNSLYQRTAEHTGPLEKFLQYLIILTEYADQIMSVEECVTPYFPLDTVQESWQQLKSIVHKLGKQSKKDGKTSESHAFQALFLELGFHLFRDPQHIPEVLEELQICCTKALHARKHPEESMSADNEPSWVGVVIDILLSLLSRSSNPLRAVVTSVFPLLCPFINEDALKQILAVINPEKAEDDAMLVDESGDESDVDFDSGSSSEESDSNEQDNSKVDEQFRKKVKEALGNAAEVSDAESIVLSDSEMFKLDDTLAEAFRSRVQTGHTQLSYKDKAMLHFRVRCLDLVMEYLKSEPPMHLVMECIQPVLAAYEYGHKGRHQTQLLHKAVSTLKILTKIKKFQHQDNVAKSELKGLLESLISKCHKETDLAVAKKLYTVCVFLVLCFRRLEAVKSPAKESKKSHYLKIYLSALELFVKGSNSHVYPQLFVTLMEACPDLAWNFIEPCQEYAFDDSVRMYKKTQCFGLIFEALKYSKGQNSIAAEKWLEIGNNFMSKAIETLKNVLGSSIKPANLTELLGVVYSFYCIVKEKTGQSLLDKKEDLLPVLMEMKKVQLKKLTKNGISLRRKIILALGGKIDSNMSKKNKAEISSDPAPNEDELDPSLAEGSDEKNSDDLPSATEETSLEDSQLISESKQKKRKSKSKETNQKKMKLDSVPNGNEENHSSILGNGTEDSTVEDSVSFTESPHKKKSKSKKKKQKGVEIEDS